MRFLTRRGRETWGASADADGAVELLFEAFRSGINYFDTAYNYHAGRSERILGRFLEGVGRDRVLVADKCPVWMVGKPPDFPRLLGVQLRRLGTSRIDLYLMHSLNSAALKSCLENGMTDFLDREKRRGRILHAGFSFHDGPDSFRECVDAYDWDFAQIQYNIVDRNSQAGEAGLRYAASRGMGVVVMEPLRGGDLVRGFAPSVRAAWDTLPGADPADICLRWIWDDPDVSAVLSGMNTSGQLRANVLAASRARPRSLTPGELALASRVAEAYGGLAVTGCTRCGYCRPCPAGVAIPMILMTDDELSMFPESATPGLMYNRWIRAEHRADRCTGCGVCEERCPQRLPVRRLLAGAHSRLSGR
jgi:hypothetical protein